MNYTPIYESNKSADYRAAVKALRKVISEESFDQAQRAVAEAFHRPVKEGFIEAYGFKESSGRPCLSRLLGGRCAYPFHTRDKPCAPPSRDHESIWLKDGKPVVLVNQPYGLGTRDIVSMANLCETHGLDVSIRSSVGWHFYGRTVAVLFTAKETPLYKMYRRWEGRKP